MDVARDGAWSIFYVTREGFERICIWSDGNKNMGVLYCYAIMIFCYMELRGYEVDERFT
jgi:hypothetical protein